jgi:Na+/proline symporter
MNPLELSLGYINGLFSILIPFLMTAAVVVFLWGLVKFISEASDESAKAGGKNLMVWGMITLFVMVAFWGIIAYFQTSLNLTGNKPVGGIAPAQVKPYNGAGGLMP